MPDATKIIVDAMLQTQKEVLAAQHAYIDVAIPSIDATVAKHIEELMTLLHTTAANTAQQAATVMLLARACFLAGGLAVVGLIIAFMKG